MTVRIPITAWSKIRGYALVDEQDSYLSSQRWHLQGKGYAMNNDKVLMHRLIMGLEKGDRRQVDHENGDRLDNRRSNLRIATHAQNRQNVRSLGGTSRYRGVSYDPRRDVWRARSWANGKNVFLGHFSTEEDAAKAASEYRLMTMPYTNEARSDGQTAGQNEAA